MYFCTIATKKYVAHVRVLAKSILAVHPTAKVYFLLADRVDNCFVPATEPFHTVLLEDLGQPELVEQMTFYYNPFELCCALRGLFHEYMWRETPAESWLYFDSDILVTHELSSAFEALQSASLLLNPHNIGPANDEFAMGTEMSALRNGIFNGGFLGVRRCEASLQFIQWFAKRLARYCFLLPGLFVDQLWLDHAPFYFKGVELFSHAGANLAHWNLYQRSITRDAHGKFLVDNVPLLFAHFSGWNLEKPDEVSRYAPAYNELPEEKLRDWRELSARYRSALLANGYRVTSQWPYAFGHFDSGEPIKPMMRYRQYKEYWDSVPQRVSPFARPDDFKDCPESVPPLPAP